MLKTVLRISVMFSVSVIFMRIAGKKEIAQLEVNELVTSFMVSEIACMPITDPEVKLHHAVIFTLTVIVLEVLLAFFSFKIPLFKHLTTGKPDFLIIKGKLNKKALNKSKVSLSEIVSAMRQAQILSLKDVNYCIQEPDGSISIITSDQEQNSSLEHMLICDGKFNKTEMREFGYTQKDVTALFKSHGYQNCSEIFYLGVDDTGQCFILGAN